MSIWTGVCSDTAPHTYRQTGLSIFAPEIKCLPPKTPGPSTVFRWSLMSGKVRYDSHSSRHSTTEACQEYAEADGFSLSTPSDVRVGPFARECQTSHLVGRVVRHVFDPSSDTNFQKEEATQLERTLHSFLPLLMEQESQFGLFCAALGLCSR